MKEKLTQDYILNIVIGEDIPLDIFNEFNTVKLYVRDKDNKLNLYANIKLPYLINSLEFLDIEDDPRYFLREGYNAQTGCCRYTCEIKPLGNMKGVYRILNGQRIKIRKIEPLCEYENIEKEHTLIKKKKYNKQ